MSPIKIFFLYDKSDRIFFELFKQIFLPEKVICVNDQYEIHTELQSSGNIIPKVDVFICLISHKLLLNVDLLKILIKNFEVSRKFIMLIIDEVVCKVNIRISIYKEWKNQMNTFESQALYNDDAYNTFKTLETASIILPKHLDSLCVSMNTVTNRLLYLVNTLCHIFRSVSKMTEFTRYNDEELKDFLNNKEKEIERSSTMNVTSQNANNITNIEINSENVIMPSGDYKQYNNDLDSIKLLIASIKRESSVLSNNDSDRILCALDDIEQAINNKNKPRLTNALNNISSMISIVSAFPTLHEHMQGLAEKISSLFP